MTGKARRSWVRTVTVLVTSVALGWVGIVVLLFLLQDRILFIPSRTLEATPASVGLRHEELTVELSGGQQVHGWFVLAEESRGVILYCHGNAGNISHRLDSIRRFVRMGLDVLIFDYEGYGLSTGSPGEQELYRDARAVWEYLTVERKCSRSDIVVFGRSMGGPVAARLASEVEPAGLIIESSFTSLPDLAREKYPLFALRGLVRHKLDTLASVKAARCPVLIAHSTGDEIVSFAHGCKLFAAAPEPKSFLELRGDHNSGPERSGALYESGLLEFIDGVLAR